MKCWEIKESSYKRPWPFMFCSELEFHWWLFDFFLWIIFWLLHGWTRNCPFSGLSLLYSCTWRVAVLLCMFRVQRIYYKPFSIKQACNLLAELWRVHAMLLPVVKYFLNLHKLTLIGHDTPVCYICFVQITTTKDWNFVPYQNFETYSIRYGIVYRTVYFSKPLGLPLCGATSLRRCRR